MKFCGNSYIKEYFADISGFNKDNLKEVISIIAFPTRKNAKKEGRQEESYQYFARISVNN